MGCFSFCPPHFFDSSATTGEHVAIAVDLSLEEPPDSYPVHRPHCHCVLWIIQSCRIFIQFLNCNISALCTQIQYTQAAQYGCKLHSAEGSPVKMLPVIIGLLKSGGAGGQPEPFTLMITISNINTLLPLLPSILQPPSSPQTAEWRRQSCWESHSHTLYNQLCAAVMVLKL